MVAVAPKKIPFIDIASSIESVARKMDEESASNLTNTVCNVLKKAKPPPPNLDKDERTALKTLRMSDNITILPADKGNATVVMDTDQYKEKLKNLLEDPVYDSCQEIQHWQ